MAEEVVQRAHAEPESLCVRHPDLAEDHELLEVRPRHQIQGVGLPEHGDQDFEDFQFHFDRPLRAVQHPQEARDELGRESHQRVLGGVHNLTQHQRGASTGNDVFLIEDAQHEALQMLIERYGLPQVAQNAHRDANQSDVLSVKAVVQEEVDDAHAGLVGRDVLQHVRVLRREEIDAGDVLQHHVVLFPLEDDLRHELQDA
eukprot:scaffold7740_cov267-Pinguiococcus_pyrenoidosus.AAC.2